MANEKVTLVLDRNDVGQMLEGLRVRQESWDATADYLATGVSPQGVVEECSEVEEAEEIAATYKRLIEEIEKQKKAQAEPWRVRILWGQAPEPEDQPQEYSFNTEAELDAFMQGIQEAEGWMGYEAIYPNGDGTWQKLERELDAEQAALDAEEESDGEAV